MPSRSSRCYVASLKLGLIALLVFAVVPTVRADDPSPPGAVAKPMAVTPEAATVATESPIAGLLAEGHCSQALSALLRIDTAPGTPHMLIWACRAQHQCGRAEDALAACNAVLIPTGAFSAEERAEAQNAALVASHRRLNLSLSEEDRQRLSLPDHAGRNAVDRGGSFLVAGGVLSGVGVALLVGGIILSTKKTSCVGSSGGNQAAECDNVAGGILAAGLGGAQLVIGTILLGVGRSRYTNSRKRN